MKPTVAPAWRHHSHRHFTHLPQYISLRALPDYYPTPARRRAVILLERDCIWLADVEMQVATITARDAACSARQHALTRFYAVLLLLQSIIGGRR